MKKDFTKSLCQICGAKGTQGEFCNAHYEQVVEIIDSGVQVDEKIKALLDQQAFENSNVLSVLLVD